MNRKPDDVMEDPISALVRTGAAQNAEISIGRHCLIVEMAGGSESPLSAAEFMRLGAWMQCRYGSPRRKVDIDQPTKDRGIKYGEPLVSMVEEQAELLECSVAEVFRRGAKVLVSAIRAGNAHLITEADGDICRQIVRVEPWPS